MRPTCVQTEALVLQVSPCRERDRLISLFSPLGLIKLFVRVSEREASHLAALTLPFTCAECTFLPNRSSGENHDLGYLLEGMIIDSHTSLRESYETLHAAAAMADALLRSQWPGKEAVPLYQLVSLLLHHLPEALDPSSIVSFFLIKLLSHEGVLHLDPSACFPLHRFAGGCYLPHEAPHGAIVFHAQEEQCLTLLARCRSLSPLKTLQLPKSFQSKITTLFSQFLTF